MADLTQFFQYDFDNAEYDNADFNYLVDTMASVKPARRGFHPVDIVLFVGLLALSLGVGVYYSCTGGKQKSMDEYLLAGRGMSFLPVGISMLMSSASAILVLGNPAEAYTRGGQFAWLVVGSTIAQIISAYLFVPLFFNLQLTSAYMYFEKRFKSSFVRRLASVLTIITGVISMGLSMYAPATAMQAVTFFPTWASIVICGVVAVIYTTMGGMKTVIWTDTIQGVVYIGGMVVILILGTVKVGGFGEVFRIANEGGRLNFIHKDSFNPDPTVRLTLWSLVLGSMFRILGSALNQFEIQRYLTVKTEAKARNAVLVKAPVLLICNVMMVLMGLVIYAYYAKLRCDPLRAGFIRNPTQLLPYFVVNVINYPGIPGILLAMLFSGSLSTLSSTMNAIATLLWTDLLEDFITVKKESQKTFITKVIVLVSGLISIGFAFMFRYITGNIAQAAASFVGSWASPIFGLFILGSFFLCSNAKGAVVGVLSGTALGLWMAIGAYITKPHRVVLPTDISNCTLPPNITIPPPPTNPPNVFPLYKFSFLLIPVMSAASCILIGLLISFLTGPTKKKDVDSALLIPFSQRCCCCCPPHIRARLCACNEAPQDDIADDVNKEEGKTDEVHYVEVKFDADHTKMNTEIKMPSSLHQEMKNGHINPTFDSTQL